jgi:hypothetical protein
MIAVIVFATIMVGLTVGLISGLSLGQTRTREALKLARYRDAIALADDLVKTPDALDLRERAQKILADHRTANPDKEF